MEEEEEEEEEEVYVELFAEDEVEEEEEEEEEEENHCIAIDDGFLIVYCVVLSFSCVLFLQKFLLWSNKATR